MDLPLPALNAFLNGTSAVLLGLGFFFVKKKIITAHKICMLSAFFVSMAFLISYLYYHAVHGSTHFSGHGWMRFGYLLLLLSHTLLAAAVLPLAITTLTHALRGQFDRHVRWARWTWPVWIYVSVTGVAIYFILY